MALPFDLRACAAADDDLPRLIKYYGRTAESVFPTGVYPGGSGVTYGTAMSIPFVLADQQRYNPHITSGCQTGP